MEKEKNKQTIIIILCVIIIILLTLVILLGTNTISFKEKINNNNNQSQTENTPTDKDENILKDENTTQSDTQTNQVPEENKISIAYKTEEYTTKNDNGYIITINRRNLPIITNIDNQELADKIVASLTSISDTTWINSIKKTADETTNGYGSSANKDLDLGITYLFKTGVVKENRLTFELERSGSFGGVTWPELKGYNYDLKTGELLTLETIANDNITFVNTIITEANNQLSTSNYQCLTEGYSSKLESLIKTTGNWYFTETTFKIVIPKYEIACGADGVVIIEIDNSKINNLLKDEYKY